MKFLLLIAMLPTIAAAGQCPTVASPAHTNALIELYTSEGCDSCPPADRWLSRFTNSRAQPSVVPVAFHVDYWDYIGWKDRFADPKYSERQRVQARARGSRAIYTPQVVVAGRDQPAWRSDGDFSRAVEAVNRRPARARIEIRWDRPAGNAGIAGISAEAANGERPEHLALFIATVENGLSSRVTAGENKGATLSHDYVVRDLAMLPFSPTSRSIDATSREVAPRDGANAERLSIAVFVQNLVTGEVLQALSAPLCRG